MHKQLVYAAIALLTISISACEAAVHSTQSSSDVSQVSDRKAYPPRRLTVVDEVETNSSFFEFRERLRAAVRDRDASYIRSIAASPIKLSFGVSPNSLDDLDIDNPDALVWQHLEKVVAAGCADANRLYDTASTSQNWVCPYVFAVEGIDRAEFSEQDGVSGWEVFIVGENVPVQAEASTNSARIGLLSNERALLDNERLQAQAQVSSDQPQSPAWYGTQGWMPIILPIGDRGYVENRYLYDVMGYRAFFSQHNGKWQMEAFVAGD